MFVSGHHRNDLRSLRLHQAIADKLREDPTTVLTKARANLAKWQDDASAAYYVHQWQDLLNGPMDRLMHVLLEESEHATALRHASPFGGVLTPKERWTIYRALKEEWPLEERPI